MNQLTLLLEELPVNLSQSAGCGEGLKILEVTSPSPMLEYLTNLSQLGASGRMSQVFSVPMVEKTFQPSSQRWLTSGMGSPTECLMLNSLEYHNEGEGSLLSDVLEGGKVPRKYYLSKVATQGILRRYSQGSLGEQEKQLLVAYLQGLERMTDKI